jgi:Gram-negative bacterial TonB protein C-terminal
MVEKLPADNPYGKTVEVPGALPQKLVFADVETMAAFFLSVHVDPTGRPLSVRRDRDPVPSLAAETLKSVSRWTFAPARKGGQPVDTWGAYRIDLQVEIRAPKITQMTLTPVAPSAPVPKPFDWKTDADWLEGRHVAPPDDGSVPIDQVDTAPIPQKTPWSGDSYKGPFTARYWVFVDKTGRITKAIPLEISDPVLLAYLRKAMGGWLLRPAQSAGAPVDSWNELLLGGTVSYSDDIKQIIALRKNIGP